MLCKCRRKGDLVMSKAIMISIRPKYVAKILNGEKTIEVRKQFPVDYVGWIYIYCTKGGHIWKASKWFAIDKPSYAKCGNLNGKVVARFWCNKVEDYGNGCLWRNKNKSYSDYEKILKPSCLTEDELYDYCEDLCFYAIYITKLEIFETPRDISEFKHEVHIRDNVRGWYYDIATLKRPPQSWLRIIEGE